MFKNGKTSVRKKKGNLTVPVQDNQQMFKGVASFYYTHQITPTCFGSSLPCSGVYTFLVSYSSIVCASGGCGLCFARCGLSPRNAFRIPQQLPP
jgi:hypothetical protein